jgi:TatD DNase family protein
MGWLGETIVHDMHCHLDLYPSPYEVAIATEQQKILTVAVTNLPSAYYDAKPHMQQFHYLKLAVGMHPSLALHHTAEEKKLFRQAFLETRYIGEVGLDFSGEGAKTKDKQIETFKLVLSLLQQQRRIVTLHSRHAEAVVLQLLDEFDVRPVIFHWYSGPLKLIDEIVGAGHYFSVNPAVIGSRNGQRIIGRIPGDRILTESDGPFVKADGESVTPLDIPQVVQYLADRWGGSYDEAIERLDINFVDYAKCAGLNVMSCREAALLLQE